MKEELSKLIVVFIVVFLLLLVLPDKDDYYTPIDTTPKNLLTEPDRFYVVTKNNQTFNCKGYQKVPKKDCYTFVQCIECDKVVICEPMKIEKP